MVRPTETKGAAMSVVKFLTDTGLFRGQSAGFFATLQDLADAADAARAGGRHGEQELEKRPPRKTIIQTGTS